MGTNEQTMELWNYLLPPDLDLMMDVGVCLTNKLSSWTYWLSLLLSVLLKQKFLLPRLERRYKRNNNTADEKTRQHDDDHRDDNNSNAKGHEKIETVMFLWRWTVAFSFFVVVTSLCFRTVMLTLYYYSVDWKRRAGSLLPPTTTTTENDNFYFTENDKNNDHLASLVISYPDYNIFSCDGSALEIYMVVFCLIHLAHSGVLACNNKMCAATQQKQTRLLSKIIDQQDLHDEKEKMEQPMQPRTIKGRMIV
jgi:hypothetical protein